MVILNNDDLLDYEKYECEELDYDTRYELEKLAKLECELGYQAKAYLEFGGRPGWEWRRGVGPIDVRDICEKNQLMLQELFQLCTNKVFFETFFKQSWLIDYQATVEDQDSLSAFRLCHIVTQQKLLNQSFSKKFRKQIQTQIQTQKVSFDVFFLRAVFDVLAKNLCRTNFRIDYSCWYDLISLALHPTKGYKVSLIFMTFNLKKISTTRAFERATMHVLNSDEYTIFSATQIYRLDTSFLKKNLEQLLEFFEIPKTIINELLIGCVEQQTLTPIITFLKKNNWFTKSSFAQGFAPPSTDEKILELKKNIAIVRDYAHLRAHLAEIHNQVFKQDQIDLASFEGNPIQKIVQFFVLPAYFQSYKDLIFKQDVRLIELFDVFFKAIVKRNELLANLLTPETFISEGDKLNGEKLADYTKIFLDEAGNLFEYNSVEVQPIIEKYRFRDGLVQKNLTKQNLKFVLSLCIALIGIGYASIGSNRPTGFPPMPPCRRL